MPTASWTFSTLTTTGYESDLDVNLGLSIQGLGDASNPPADNKAVPCPSVAGFSGNGRLLASFGHYNGFSTGKLADFAHTAGNPITLTFRWRPLIEFPSSFGTYSMLGFNILGYVSGGGVGNLAMDVEFINGASTSEYTIAARPLGGSVTYMPTTMSIRDWHLITVSYDGVDTWTFSVDGSGVGTVTYNPASSSDLGRICIAAFGDLSGGLFALCGVVDSISFTIS